MAVGVATAALSAFSFAQDTKTTTTNPDKTDRWEKREGAGKGHFGRGQRGEGRRGGFERGGMMGLRGVDLTDAQKQQIRTIMQSNKPDPAVRQELRTLVRAVHDGTSTGDQQARIKDLRQQMEAKRKAVHEQLLSVLTADQKAQLQKRKAEMKQRRQEFREKRKERRENKTTTPPATKTII